MSIAPKDLDEGKKAIAAAKVEILAAIGDTDARLELGMVKSIQRGYCVGSKILPITITISPVNTDKSVVLINGNCENSSSHRRAAVLGDFTTDSFEVVYDVAGEDIYVLFNWMVIEFY